MGSIESALVKSMVIHGHVLLRVNLRKVCSSCRENCPLEAK